MTDENVESEQTEIEETQEQTSDEEVNDSEVEEQDETENTTESTDRGDLRIPLKEERTKRQTLEQKLKDPEFIRQQAEELGLMNNADEYNPYTQPVDNTNPYQALADENGDIDPISLAKTTEERAYNRIKNERMAEDFERNDWQNAVKEFPVLADNEELSQIIKENRLSRILSGKGYVPYKEIAKQIIGLITTTEQKGIEKGKEDAQVQERIVNRASLGQPSNASDDSIPEKDKLEELMQSTNHAVATQARQEYISKFL